MLDVLGWISTSLTLLGIWLLGAKRIEAFVASGAGNVCWIWYGTYKQDWPLVGVNLVILCMNMRNIYLWKKQ